MNKDVSYYEEMFKEAFELEGAELHYRYCEETNSDKKKLYVIKPIHSYESWAKSYISIDENIDVYDYIIKNLNNENIEVKTGKERDLFLNENPTYDIESEFIVRKIEEILEYNNLTLAPIAPLTAIVEEYRSEINNYGQVIEYIEQRDFIESLMAKGYIEIEWKSPFKNR
ncbi:hypothetical protein [Staphylococcus aureus]|uniref:hypothetical protein n=1 Tax=Staphylococcus aureus TaxID=1280 RepID=UPI000DE2C7AD|nr:hypothetical protein [Staphylococcus aureus]